MGKVLCVALSICSCVAFAQEIKKENGKTVIILDEKESAVCEKYGCIIVPMPVIEQLVKETASYMCGKKI